jgi:hypothetical protein
MVVDSTQHYGTVTSRTKPGRNTTDGANSGRNNTAFVAALLRKYLYNELHNKRFNF